MRKIYSLTLLLLAIVLPKLFSQPIFVEDFEGDLSQWQLRGEQAISQEVADKSHGKSLKLKSEGIVYALMKQSDKWGAVAVSGEFMFPDSLDNYLGFIYHFSQSKARSDFGSIYIKGNDSYIRVNPFRDGNASRLLYEEYRVPLQGASSIQISKWHKFKIEVQRTDCHLYIDDMSVPKITFSHYEGLAGKIGFQPRVAGFPVFIDNISVTSLSNLSYTGAPIPSIIYDLKNIVRDWQFTGPFEKPQPAIEAERYESVNGKWLPFSTDERGSVITARVTEFDGSRDVAYFRTILESEQAKSVTLHFSSTEELALYINGEFQGFVYRQGYGHKTALDWNAWFDFNTNEAHSGKKIDINLKKGKNVVMVRSRNGQFASGGFFMAVE